ncbi:MAG: pyridoxamine 5'-phosphate oxidase [Gemmatimonadota bacterium]|nr:pyridoxamine 5'-phosphate oxidase [Gemmatimonadota bacterium]
MSLRSNIRALFTLGRGVTKGISELTAAQDPVEMFVAWFEEAKQAGIFLPESVNLATATKDGVPSSRMMLLKGVDQRGFVLFTNYESRKSGELIDNPRAALNFYWGILERQVRVEGVVEQISQQESEAYFRTRPRGSRIGAWASRQSSPLESREALERRFKEFDERYPGNDVPLPPFWGGWRLKPERIEFWQGRLNRLHDRLRYERDGNAWQVTRLFP